MLFREILENEKEKFNSFVTASRHGHLFQSYEWGEVKRGDGWLPRRFVVEENGIIRAAVQVLEKKLAWWSILYAPRGPVLDYHAPAVLEFLLDGIKKTALERGAVFFQMDPDIEAGDAEAVGRIGKKGFILRPGGVFLIEQPRFVFRLNIARGPDEAAAGFSQSARRNIRIAQRAGVTVEVNNTPEGLRAHYELFRRTSLRRKFLARPFSFQRRIFEKLMPGGLVDVLLASYRGEHVASLLMCSFAGKSFYMYVGSDFRHPEIRAGYLVAWAAMRLAWKKGCRVFDFRGVGAWNLPEHPERGVFEFKSKFSPDFCRFSGEHYLVLKPRIFSAMILAESAFRSLLKLVRKAAIPLPRFRPEKKYDKLNRAVRDKYGEEEELRAYSRVALENGLGFEEKFVARYITRPGKLLVSGCGAGRETIHFGKKGFSVYGIDIQPRMIEEALKNERISGIKSELSVMSATDLKFDPGIFDYCVMLGQIIAHIPGRENRILALREAHRVMKDAGTLIISAPSKHCGLKYRIYFLIMDPLRRLLRLAGLGAFEPGDRLIKVSIPGAVSKGRIFFHMYSLAEMEQDLSSAGFKLVKCLSRREIISGVENPRDREKDYFFYFCAVKK